MLLCLLAFLCVGEIKGQDYVTIRGTVSNLRGETLPGANVLVKNTFSGTSTDGDGKFVMKMDVADLPLGLVFSFIGYNDLHIEVRKEMQKDLVIQLIPKDFLGNEIIFTASRIPERMMQSPVTIDRVQEDEIAMRTAPDLYNAISYHPAIDVSSSSMLINSVSTRGFSDPASSRLVHLVDNIDVQLPSLGLNFGNMAGAPELDIQSIEIVHGPSSSLYGSNAFNGVVHTRTKNPFYHEGTTLDVRFGEKALMDIQARVAKKINNFLAYKVNVSAFRSNDWLAENTGNISPSSIEDNVLVGNNAVNSYGDVRRWIDSNGDGELDAQIYLPGWSEKELLNGDNATSLIRLQAGASYIVNDKLKINVLGGLNIGSGLFQSFSRLRIKSYRQSILRAEIEGGRWIIRAVNTSDTAGDSYDLNTLGTNMLKEPVGDINGVQVENLEDYYVSELLQAFEETQSWEKAADIANELMPSNGESLFDVLRAEVRQSARPGRGARLDFGSVATDISGQYEFDWKYIECLVGGAVRQTKLSSNGTFYADTNEVAIKNREAGLFTHLAKEIAPRLRFSFSGRIDFFENFSYKFSPRASLVWAVDKNKRHNFRLSYGRAFRSPTKVEQHLYLQTGENLVIGNITDGYRGFEPGSDSFELEDQIFLHPLDLERVDSYEFGYKNRLGRGFILDLNTFYNYYNDFIYRKSIFTNLDGSVPDVTENQGRTISTWANNSESLETFGATAGMVFQWKKYLGFHANYSYNKFIQNSEEQESPLASIFNTPENKFNVGFFGLIKNKVGYRVNYRSTDAFYYDSAFAAGELPSRQTIDFSFSYLIPKYKTTLKLIGNNITNDENIQVYGSASIGRLILLGATIDLN